jgi:hypothetical protein
MIVTVKTVKIPGIARVVSLWFTGAEVGVVQSNTTGISCAAMVFT